MKPLSPEILINKFNLLPHPEGGWFKETYRSGETINTDNGNRNLSTAIFFLLEQGNFSAFHRIKSDECWHFYAGDPLSIFIIHQNGTLETIYLGNDILNGQVYQHVVPANTWFASIPSNNSNYCFVGCTVSPGFDFNDFELAFKKDLSQSFPQHKELIFSLCRQ
jgi:predicted cupin superfamily sugar epimerase